MSRHRLTGGGREGGEAKEEERGPDLLQLSLQESRETKQKKHYEQGGAKKQKRCGNGIGTITMVAEKTIGERGGVRDRSAELLPKELITSARVYRNRKQSKRLDNTGNYETWHYNGATKETVSTAAGNESSSSRLCALSCQKKVGGWRSESD